MNLYSYVDGNPANGIDPFGLWASEYHNEFAKYAAEQVCPNLKDKLPQLTALADFIDGTSTPQNSFQHSMRDGSEGSTQSIDEAKKLRDDFVDNSLSDCSIEGLARALHAIQDESSESHSWKPWDGGGYKGFPGWKHFWKDLYGASKSSKYSAMIASSNLLHRFKEQCPCACQNQ